MTTPKAKELKWHKLDNTAQIYPVIAGEDLSGVYRISVTLKEQVDPERLQEALEKIIPWFEGFHVRLRRGIFWYYFETNQKIPRVEEEYTYPCRYIDPYSNNQYLFRVSYYKRRIHTEVFHALTDGYGAVNFMRELVSQYLRLVHRDAFPEVLDRATRNCSFNMEDSYLKYYKKSNAKGYSPIKAYQLKGKLLGFPGMQVIHGYLDVADLKRVCKGYGATITQYLAAVMIHSIYQEGAKESDAPIRINIPVNLRQFFESTTTMNFFGVAFAELAGQGREYTFLEILEKVKADLERQITKAYMEERISYNVSNEMNPWLRRTPLFIKNMGIRYLYNRSAKSFTTTISNLGLIRVLPEYEDYIENFHFVMGVSKKQPVKSVVCSYGNQLVFTFSSVFEDTSLQRAFFKKIAADGVHVKVESNGVLS